MVDQPEGRPKSPKPGKVKSVTKKHSVSKPYERPSSSRGVLARVKELITPVTPGWLKDLVLKPPQTTSVTDALEQTVAEVQAVEDKDPERFKKTLKTLSLPVIDEKSVPKILPFTSERIAATPVPNIQTAHIKEPVLTSQSVLDISSINSAQANLSTSTNILEETLGEIKWSSIRPAVKQKYSFSLAAFNTPSKSPNVTSIPIHNKSLTRANTTSPFTNRSRVSFGGNSLQRSLLHNRSNHNNTTITDEQKPIKVKPISRTTIRPGVTSNTAKKILEQLESLSRPLGHLPSSRPSTPSSRQGSRASTPLSMSRSSTPQHLQPYANKTERSIPIRSLTSTPQERQTDASSFGGKMKREKSNHYSRIKEEEEEEIALPEFKTVTVPSMDFKPIVIESEAEHKPIKIVNQTQQKSDLHVPLKDAIRNSPTSKSSLLPHHKKNPNSPSASDNENISTDSSFSFSTPITVTNSALGLSFAVSDTAEFSFGTPNKLSETARNKRKSIDEVLKSVREAEVEKELEISSQQPPGSWSCVPCKLSNPCAMTRCSGCEAPNPSLAPGLFIKQSPIGIKRAPITPMKPASSPKLFKSMSVSIAEEEEEPKETRNPLVKFALQQQPGWSCDTCMLKNKEEVEKCIACQAPKSSPSVVNHDKVSNKLAGMDNPLLKFKNTNNWSCDSCMLSNPPDQEKCRACQAVKPTAHVKPNPLDKFKCAGGWECSACMLKNDNDLVKCKACTTDKPVTKDNQPTKTTNPLDKFKSNKWECGTCMLNNNDYLQKCPACETTRPAAKTSPAANPLNKFKSANEWECGTCMLKNNDGLDKCKACETANPNKKSSNVLSFGSFSQSGWSCGTCMLLNPEDLVKCKACQTDKPGADKKEVESSFKFGTTATDVSDKPKFSFGVPAGTSGDIKGISFGLPPSKDGGKASENKPAFSFGVKSDAEGKANDTKPAFSFEATATDSKPLSFGVKSATETKPIESTGTKAPETNPTFSFGSSGESKPAFSFGSVTSDTTPAAAPPFSFGTTAPTVPEKKETPAFNFGGPTAAAGDAKPLPASGFGFGNTTSPSPASFNFGSKTASTTPSFNFGGNKPTEAAAVPTFGAVTPKPAAASTFGAATPVATAPGFQFGAAPAETGDTMDASSQSPKSFGFGQKPVSTTNANGPSFNFGSNNENKPPSTGFNFGSTPNSFSSSNTPAPAFGATAAPSFGAAAAPPPTFGASNTPAPAPFSFGQSSASPAAFGQTQSTASTGFNFGGPAKPATSGFNFSATPQQQPAAGSFSFGGAPSSSPAPSFNFGGGSTTTENKSFAFGSNATNPAPSFGSTNTPAAPTPSFGSSTPSFGSNNNTPASLPAPAFNFGASNSAPSNSTFQFGSPQTTPTQNNVFNPVTTSASGRKIRKAVRRTKR